MACLQNMTIERVERLNLFGLIVDEQPSRKAHTGIVANRIAKYTRVVVF